MINKRTITSHSGLIFTRLGNLSNLTLESCLKSLSFKLKGLNFSRLEDRILNYFY